MKKTASVLLLSLMLATPLTGQALRVPCGGYMAGTKRDSIKHVLDIYEAAYKKEGFVVTKRKLEQDVAQLEATLIVASSPYQMEVSERFDFGESANIKGIHHCATSTAIKEPKEYDAKQRNAYVSKFEDSLRAIEKDIDLRLKKEFSKE
jgi:hypothetical protein